MEKSKTTSVYLFKNGNGFISTVVPVSAKESKYVLFDPPINPIHGTFWIEGKDNCKVTKVSTKDEIKTKKRVTTDIASLLLANVGKNLKVLYETDKESKWISGKLLQVTQSKPKIENGPTKVGQLVIFEVKDTKEQAVLFISGIKSVFTEKDTTLETTLEEKKVKNSQVVEYKVQEGKDLGHLSIKYMTSGITWAPSYHFQLLPAETSQTKKELIISSKAVVLNDTETLNANYLACIAGFPNIKFSNVTDPMAKRQSVNSFISSLTDRGSSRSFRRENILTQNITSNFVTSNRAQVSVRESDTSSMNSGNNSDDLHLYEFKNVLLTKSERVSVPIFTQKSTYTDIYHCKVHEQSSSSLQESLSDVWHAIDVKNDTKHPWTTGTALVTRGDQFVCHNQVNFTSVGATARVDISKSLLVIVSSEEKSNKSKEKSVQFEKRRITQCHSQVIITITNKSSNDIKLSVTTNTTGELSDFNSKPTSSRDLEHTYYGDIKRELNWIIDVESGKTKTLKFTKVFHR